METSRNGKMSSVLFSIKNEFMESDPLDINAEIIKHERIDGKSFRRNTKSNNFQTSSYLWHIVDVDNGFSTGNYALPIDTIIAVQPNAFMTKKTNKKKASKNGQVEKEDHSSCSQVLSNKNHRKDKGNKRVTSYMLWSRDKRQQLIATQPELDFADISREIGKMWSNVPTNEKYNWKRRAKRLNAKNKASEMKQTADEHIRSLPFGYNADHNSAESTNNPMEQWTITEVAEAEISGRHRKQTGIEDDVFLKKTNRTRTRDKSKKNCNCGTDDKRTPKKKVEISSKSWCEIQSFNIFSDP